MSGCGGALWLYSISSPSGGVSAAAWMGFLEEVTLGWGQKNPSLAFSDPAPQPNQEVTPVTGSWVLALSSTRCCGLNVADGLMIGVRA